MNKRNYLPAVVAFGAAIALGGGFMMVNSISTLMGYNSLMNSKTLSVDLTTGVYSEQGDKAAVDWTADYMKIHQTKVSCANEVGTNCVTSPVFNVGDQITFTPTTKNPITSITVNMDEESFAHLDKLSAWNVGKTTLKEGNLIWTGVETFPFTLSLKEEIQVYSITYTYGY